MGRACDRPQFARGMNASGGGPLSHAASSSNPPLSLADGSPAEAGTVRALFRAVITKDALLTRPVHVVSLLCPLAGMGWPSGLHATIKIMQRDVDAIFDSVHTHVPSKDCNGLVNHATC